VERRVAGQARRLARFLSANPLRCPDARYFELHRKALEERLHTPELLRQTADSLFSVFPLATAERYPS
tara:strand:- start:391 stop:594 length:204 start_codon:yes stop_codon:yes gene_type:complete